MATLRVAPKQLVKVPVPVGTSKAQMAFGDEQPTAAFIENAKGRRGEIVTNAMRRCPDLRSGSRVTVRVYHADGVSELSVQVV